MPLSKLDEQASAGLDNMDREHAVELQLVRSLQSALVAGDRARAAALMGQLNDFANAHFLAEQLMMRLHAYPGFASHEAAHDRLIAELRELSTRILGESAADARASVEALELWMLTHIQTEDEAMAAYLRLPAAAGTRD